MSLYTIGYAGKNIDTFILHLKENHVKALADVRSLPYSRMFSEYNCDCLKDKLAKVGILYVYLGKELGPRSEDPRHYNEDGQVQFEKLQESEIFLSGIERIKTGLEKGISIAMMCAEKDPLTCHRSLLIAEHLVNKENIPVSHISFEGDQMSHDELVSKKARDMGHVPDFFTTEDVAIQNAVNELIKAHAYTKPVKTDYSY